MERSGNYWLIYSNDGGKAQFNQTKSSQGFKIYNWYGSSASTSVPNTSDTGCQYLIVEAEVEELTDAITSATVGTNATCIYTLSGQRVPAMDRPGIYIVRRNGQTRKILVTQ